MQVQFPSFSQSQSLSTTMQPRFGARPMMRPAQPDRITLRFGLAPNTVEKEAQAFVRTQSRALQRLTLEYYEAMWNMYCQGGEYQESDANETNEAKVTRLGIEYKDFYNKPKEFAVARRLMRQRDRIRDWGLRRQVRDLYRGFEDAGKTEDLLALEKQLIAETNRVSVAHNKHCATVDGAKVSNQELASRLEKENDPEEAKKLWLARNSYWQAKVGVRTLTTALTDLVKLRNEVAQQNTNDQSRPFSDYFSMQLYNADIDERQLVRLLDQVDEATREPYEAYMALTNRLSARRYGVSEDNARLPWLGSGNRKRLLKLDMNKYLKGKDPVALIKKTAQLMGDDVSPIFDASTYERNGQTRSALYFDKKLDEGKSQHWFSFGIAPPVDVRTFGSIDPKHQKQMDYAVETLLHETTGHGLDSLHVSSRLPYLLRGHHSITTESHAMLLPNVMQEQKWWEKVVGLPKEEAAEVAQKAKLMNQIDVVSGIRWMVSLIQFERQMYKNPDQDLTKLWWDLQAQYLGDKKPSGRDAIPAYVRVPHFFSHPVYYQNYFLAELARAQKLEKIKADHGGLLTKGAGAYLKEFRKVGESYDWDDLVERMTGEPLGVEALKREFADLDVSSIKLPRVRRK